MERFRVSIRDQVHTIGVPEPGVLTVIVDAVVRHHPDRGLERECKLKLGGLESATDTFVDWTGYDLEPGDQIVIDVLPEGPFDQPPSARQDIREIVRDAKARSARQLAGELGWTLIENDSPPES